MTPDANPLLGPLPGRRGLLGGGRPVAQRVRRWRRDRPGDGRLDHDRRPRGWTSGRTGRGGSATRTATRRSRPGSARETYSDYYRLRYPYDADLAGRPRRLSRAPRPPPGDRRGLRHEGRLGAGRPARAGSPWRRPGATRRPTAGPGRPGSIACATRRGPSASGSGSSTSARSARSSSRARRRSALLQRVAANDVDRPSGRVDLHAVLDERGGIVADVTVTRLAPPTGSGSSPGLGRRVGARLAPQPSRRRRAVDHRDVSDASRPRPVGATRSRDPGGGHVEAVGDAAIPVRRAGSVEVAGVLASRSAMRASSAGS